MPREFTSCMPAVSWSLASPRIFSQRPQHPYTIGLLNCVPKLDEEAGTRKLVPIDGLPPNLINMPPTCAFLPRCTRKVERCLKEPWPALTRRGRAALRSLLCRYKGEVMTTSDNNVMVDVKDLKMYFPITRGLFRKKVGDVKAVDEISFIIKKT